MELLTMILSVLFVNSTIPLETVTADSPFITGNGTFNADIEAFNASSISFFDDCNLNPGQYNKFHRKIIPLRCETCLKEIWSIGGTSMNPTLKSGNLLKFSITPEGFKNLTEGMIVIYDPRTDINGSPLDLENAKKYDYNIIHRIVAVNEKNYVIKGDNPETNGVCELIPKDEIKAVLENIDY